MLEICLLQPFFHVAGSRGSRVGQEAETAALGSLGGLRVSCGYLIVIVMIIIIIIIVVIVSIYYSILHCTILYHTTLY